MQQNDINSESLLKEAMRKKVSDGFESQVMSKIEHIVQESNSLSHQQKVSFRKPGILIAAAMVSLVVISFFSIGTPPSFEIPSFSFSLDFNFNWIYLIISSALAAGLWIFISMDRLIGRVS